MVGTASSSAAQHGQQGREGPSHAGSTAISVIMMPAVNRNQSINQSVRQSINQSISPSVRQWSIIQRVNVINVWQSIGHLQQSTPLFFLVELYAAVLFHFFLHFFFTFFSFLFSSLFFVPFFFGFFPHSPHISPSFPRFFPHFCLFLAGREWCFKFKVQVRFPT